MTAQACVYHRYWGKARHSPEEGGPPCHLLPYHCLDVAAVGTCMLAADTGLVDRLATALRLERDELTSFFGFALAVHDIGKFARAFQGLATPEGIDLVAPDPRMSYSVRHDALGMQAWYEAVVPRLREQGGCGLPEGTGFGLTLKASTALWLGCAFGHHGKPVAVPRQDVSAGFKPEDLDAVWAFVSDAAALIQPQWPVPRLQDQVWRERVLQPMSWQLAGLAILCDWLGSDQTVFRYVAEPLSLDDYWHEYALPRAEQAVQRSGVSRRFAVSVFAGFEQTYGFVPTPLQSWAESVPIAQGPQLFLLEDVTGAGKTEAATTLVHRLLERGCGDGLYFGLPTMATSNAMYERLGAFYRRFYEDGASPSLVLAHGARHLNDTFRRSMVPEHRADRAYADSDASASIESIAWLADNRKKALLAEVGVGTIDQALLGILPLRHQSLRLLGLVHKVLVVDEVHAYDTYTATLLRNLLEAHARAGGSAILLSATIPQALRRGLVSAWQRGRAVDQENELHSEAFPLATHVHDRQTREYPLQAAPASCRRLPVAFIDTEAQALETILAAARSGQCACWIRNTVDDAIDAYRQVVAHVEDPERVLLFHARFVMGDRQRIEGEALRRFGGQSDGDTRAGRVLIATQVVEQSLDLDFDVLVSDLAPIDLLIQRAGRLHRHRRDAAGNRLPSREDDDSRPKSALTVLAPLWTEEPAVDWLKGLLPVTGHVYRDTARLWLTCKLLRECGAIELPQYARPLLEGVYGADVDIPTGLEHASLESYAEGRAHASGAAFNALDLARGYVPESGQGAWEEDEDIGTRLANEASMAVVLLRADEHGQLRPWITDSAHPWDMSTVNLRQSQVKRLPDVPERFQAQAETLRAERRALRYAVFWMPDEAPEGAVRYDNRLGAMVSGRINSKQE